MKKNFNIKGIAVTTALAALTVVSITGCGKKADDKTIKIGVTPVPHEQIVNDVVKPILEEKGYTVEVVEFNDYVQPNTALEDGEIDANYFQTTKYLDEENKQRSLHLVSIAEIHLEPMGLYANSATTLEELPDGAEIAIPNDGSNESRAISLLGDSGLITLTETEDLYTLQNIEENPHGFVFTEIEAANLPRTLEDVDAAVINGNYALEAGLNPETDALAKESSDTTGSDAYFNDLVVKSGNENTEKSQALKEALTSEEVKTYIQNTYQGSVIPAF